MSTPANPPPRPLSYRIHLTPGSRRSTGSATRAAASRARSTSEVSSSGRRDLQRRGNKNASAPTPPPAVPSPPIDPPPLVQAYPVAASVAVASEPPDTPPPLVQAPLSALLPPHVLAALPPPDSRSSHASTASTPDYVYHSPQAPANPELHSSARSNQYSPQHSYSSSFSTYSSPVSLNQRSQWESGSQSGTYYEPDHISESPGPTYNHPSSCSSRIASPEDYYQGETHDMSYAYVEPRELEYSDSVTSHVSSQPTSSFGSVGSQIQQVHHAHSSPSPISSLSPNRSHPPTPTAAYSTPSSATVSVYHQPHDVSASLPPSPVHASHIPVEQDPAGYTPVGHSRPRAYTHAQASAEQTHSDYSTPSPLREQPYANVYPGSVNMHSYFSGHGVPFGRYHSPPPTLAPIHTSRDSPEMDVQHHVNSQTLTKEYPISHTSGQFYPHSHHNGPHHPQSSPQDADASEDVEQLQASGHYVPLRQPQPLHPVHAYSQGFNSYSSLSYAHQNEPG
ncbi:hypothetical protein BKA93DRAFT_116163 [Sparassis latifolia]